MPIGNYCYNQGPLTLFAGLRLHKSSLWPTGLGQGTAASLIFVPSETVGLPLSTLGLRRWSHGKGTSSKKGTGRKTQQAIRPLGLPSTTKEVFDLSTVGQNLLEEAWVIKHKKKFLVWQCHILTLTPGEGKPHKLFSWTQVTAIGHGYSVTPTTMKAPLSPHLCAEPPSSTWVTMMLWGDRFDPLPPVIWIPSPSIPFRMCIFHMRQPSRWEKMCRKSFNLDLEHQERAGRVQEGAT